MLLSVIIPLHETETSWPGLCSHLLFLPEECEVIFVRSTPLKADESNNLDLLRKKVSLKWVLSKQGRAVQMNQGAKHASSDFLWFLHADSRFSPQEITLLLKHCSSDKKPHPQIYYFKLAYLKDGPLGSVLNQIGANWRSKTFNLPFGDQGLCLSKDLFELLGGYNEKAPYGEDHLLIWSAIKQNISIVCTGGTLYSSARKFYKHGWLKTTLNHHYITWKQAISEWYQWKKQTYINQKK